MKSRPMTEGCIHCGNDGEECYHCECARKRQAGDRYWWFAGELDVELVRELAKLQEGVDEEREAESA